MILELQHHQELQSSLGQLTGYILCEVNISLRPITSVNPPFEESIIYDMNLVNINNETNTMAMIFLVDFFI